MKINTTKLVVGVLAVAGVASLVGSISGTVAWFQYNTRTVAEFGGTSTKCSEYLEMRTVTTNTGIHAVAKLASTSESLATYQVGDKVIVDDDGKVYTIIEEGSVKKLDAGTAVTSGDRYEVGGTVYKWSGSAWEENNREYGKWINYLDKNAMKELTGNNGTFSPVTAPAADSKKELPELFANPICGYAPYSSWEKAAAADYMQFTLQFRVLDLDGSTAAKDNQKSMLKQNLYITDLTIEEKAGTGKQNITPALRFFITNESVTDNSKNLLFAKADDDFDTDTYGQLNLGGVDRVANDIGMDVRNNYSFSSGDLYTPLVYGTASSVQHVKGFNKAGNIYKPSDNNGKLTGGTAIGETVENALAHDITDAGYLTLTFTTWLEGWHEFGTAISGTEVDVKYIGLAPETATVGDKWFNTRDSKVYTYTTENKWGTGTDADPDNYYTTDGGKTGMKKGTSGWENVNNRIWNDTEFVGSEFNIGISFGVDAL